MLLSDDEIARFRQCDREGDPLIYQPEYDVGALPPLRSAELDSPAEPEQTAKGGERVQQRIEQAKEYVVAGDYQGVRSLVEETEQVPELRGLLGVALACLGKAHQTEALEHLSYAWRNGDRDILVLRELATIYRARRQYELAAEPYRDLLDRAPDQLDAADYLMIAQLMLLEEFGEIKPERWMHVVDRFFDLATASDISHDVADIAQMNLEVVRSINDPLRLVTAYRHSLDTLGTLADANRIVALLQELRQDHTQGRIKAHQRFDLLDEAENFLDQIPDLSPFVVDEYADLLKREMHAALKHKLPLPVWTNDLRRSLLLLDAQRHKLLYENYQQQRDELKKQGLEPPSQESEPDPVVKLDGLKIALVGGHMNTRRAVQKLLEERNAQEVVHVPPSSEAKVAAGDVQAKVKHCNLIVQIVRYGGHDLSVIIDNLQAKGSLIGDVLRVQCRGKSGVSREILDWRLSKKLTA